MRFLSKVQALTDDERVPKAIADYVRGFSGLPSAKDPAVKKYKAWLLKQLEKKSYKVYRAFVMDGKVSPGDNIFAEGHPMSFTEDKKVAIEIAKDRHSDQPDIYAYVIELDAPKEKIYFHWFYGGELGREHSKEKEVMVLAEGMHFKIVKEIKPD